MRRGRPCAGCRGAASSLPLQVGVRSARCEVRGVCEVCFPPMHPAPRTSHLALLVLGATLGCQSTFLPLKNRITPGTDAFVVFVADGQGDASELWAGQASGGAVYQVTYTLADEDAPA